MITNCRFQTTKLSEISGIGNLEFEIWNGRDLLIDPDQVQQEHIGERRLLVAAKAA